MLLSNSLIKHHHTSLFPGTEFAENLWYPFLHIIRNLLLVSISACTRVTSHVDLKTASHAHHVYKKLSLATVRTRNKREGNIVRQLITLEQLIDDLEAQDIRLDQAFIDIADVVQMPEIEEEED